MILSWVLSSFLSTLVEANYTGAFTGGEGFIIHVKVLWRHPYIP